MKWYDPNKKKPTPFVSVLVFMPGEEPLPTVHEGYLAEDGVWYANGYYVLQPEIKRWAELPKYNPADDAE